MNLYVLFLAVGGVLTFFPVIGKDLGLTATAVGITYTLLPICVFIFKPFFGFLADYFQNIKTLVICLMTAQVILAICTSFIEPINKNDTLKVHLQCYNDTDSSNLEFKQKCVNKITSIDKINCNVSEEEMSNYHARTIQVKMQLICTSNSSFNQQESKVSMNKPSDCFVLFTGYQCSEKDFITPSSLKCDYSLEKCLKPKPEINEYATYQFWIYTLLVVSCGIFFTTAMSLSDVACYEILADQKEYYGRLRLWGTAGQGVSTLIAGYFNDLMSDGGRSEYISGYFLMIIFFVSNMAILVYLRLPKANISKNLTSDVKIFIKSPEFIVYAFAVFIIGNFSGLLSNYLFWYIKDLGANQTLLGAAIAMQCLAAELPFFFFAGWFVKRLGYFNCLTCSFAAFSLRFGLYSLIKNPWLTLPVETLHGLTFAVFYSSKTAFAAVYALPGTEGTVLGILSGVCDGLGKICN